MRPRGWVESFIIGIALLVWAAPALATGATADTVSGAEYLRRFQELVDYTLETGSNPDVIRSLADVAHATYADLDNADPDKQTFRERVVDPLDNLIAIAERVESCSGLPGLGWHVGGQLLSRVRPCDPDAGPLRAAMTDTSEAAVQGFAQSFQDTARNFTVMQYWLHRWRFEENVPEPRAAVAALVRGDSVDDTLANPHVRETLQILHDNPKSPQNRAADRRETFEDLVSRVHRIAEIDPESATPGELAELAEAQNTALGSPMFWGHLRAVAAGGTTTLTPADLEDALEQYYHQSRVLLRQVDQRMEDPRSAMKAMWRHLPEIVAATVIKHPQYAELVCVLAEEILEDAESQRWWDNFWNYGVTAVAGAAALVAFFATAPVTLIVAGVIAIGGGGASMIRNLDRASDLREEAVLAEASMVAARGSNRAVLEQILEDADKAATMAILDGVATATGAVRFVQGVRGLIVAGRSGEAAAVVAASQHPWRTAFLRGAVKSAFIHPIWEAVEDGGAYRHELTAYLNDEKHVGYGIHLDMDRVRAALDLEERVLLDNPVGNEEAIAQMLTRKLSGDYNWLVALPDGHWSHEFVAPFGPPRREAFTYFDSHQGEHRLRGVCRHKAAVLAGILEELGISSEFTVGIHRESGIGHAWVEVRSLGLAFDPTEGGSASIKEFRKDYDNFDFGHRDQRDGRRY